jgi:nucleoside-diphosphate-sugar epimerase
MRLVALFDKTARLGLNDLDVRQNVDNSKIREVLGWEPLDLEEMVVAMGESFIRYGVVTPPAG